MTDIACSAGLRAILRHFNGEVALDGEVYAVIVADTYTPDAAELTMATVTPLWDGEFSNGNDNATIADAVELEGVGTGPIQMTVDATTNKVHIICDDIEFGTIDNNGSLDPGWLALFVTDTGGIVAATSYPLAILKADFDSTTEALTFVVDTDGIILNDPQ